MHCKLRFTATAAALVACAFSHVHADVPTQMNHQGAVSVDGNRFHGLGQFKFAIVNSSGINLWTFDVPDDHMDLLTVGMPTGTPRETTVENGVYSVLLGSGMPPIKPSIFTVANARLRIWFKDGVNGFQQLEDLPLTTTPYASRRPNVLVDDSGRVGIGTSTPVAALEIRS